MGPGINSLSSLSVGVTGLLVSIGVAASSTFSEATAFSPPKMLSMRSNSYLYFLAFFTFGFASSYAQYSSAPA